MAWGNDFLVDSGDGMDEQMVALVLAQGAHHQQHEDLGAEMLRVAATSRTAGIPRQPRATIVYAVQRFDRLKVAQARVIAWWHDLQIRYNGLPQ